MALLSPLACLVLCLVLCLLAGGRAQQKDVLLPKSPCPHVFLYEGATVDWDRWYGEVVVTTDIPLTGLRVDLWLSRPALALRHNWDGEVTTIDNQRFTILNLYKRVEPGPAQSIRIVVKFDERKEIPLLQAIEVNGRRVCPETPEIKRPQLPPPVPLSSGVSDPLSSRINFNNEKYNFEGTTRRPTVVYEDSHQDHPHDHDIHSHSHIVFENERVSEEVYHHHHHTQPAGSAGDGYRESSPPPYENTDRRKPPVTQGGEDRYVSRKPSSEGQYPRGPSPPPARLSSAPNPSSLESRRPVVSDSRYPTTQGSYKEEERISESRLEERITASRGDEFPRGPPRPPSRGNGPPSRGNGPPGLRGREPPGHSKHRNGPPGQASAPGRRPTSDVPTRVDPEDSLVFEEPRRPPPSSSRPGYQSQVHSHENDDTRKPVSDPPIDIRIGTLTNTRDDLDAETLTRETEYRRSKRLPRTPAKEGGPPGHRGGGPPGLRGKIPPGHGGPIPGHNKNKHEEEYYGNQPEPEPEVPPYRPPSTKRPTVTKRPLPPVTTHECGTVVSAAPLITYGQKTARGQWPWHIALYEIRGTNLEYICGGSIISNNIVITAAHCVTKSITGRPKDANTLIVYAGKYHLHVWTHEEGVQETKIDKIEVHPQYNNTNFQADLAILMLTTPMVFSHFVRPVCLWGLYDISIDSLVNKDGIVVGWGYDETQKVVDDLRMATMPIVATTTCLYSNRDFFSHFTNEKTYCAGFRNGTSACNGDSGGGMFLPKFDEDGTKVWYLRGLVSVSVSKIEKPICNADEYVVFTDVAKYQDWINNFLP